MKYSATVLTFFAAAIVAAAAPRTPAPIPPVAAVPMQAAACPTPPQPTDAATLAKRQWKGGKEEYDAYVAFAGPTPTGTPADRAKLAAAFLQKYPDSDYKNDAIIALMNNQLQSGNAASAIPTAELILKTPGMDTTQVASADLAIAYVMPTIVQLGDANLAAELTELQTAAKCGEGLENASADPPNSKATKDYFYEKASAVAAMDAKDYPSAIAQFTKLLQNPAASKDLPQYYYWIGVCQVASNPPEFQNGIYDLAHAVELQPNAPGAPVLKTYLTKVYTDFHGSADGLDQVIAGATAPAPPAGFHIKDVNEINNENADKAYAEAKAKAETEAHESDTFPGWEWRLEQPTRAAEEWKKFAAEYGTGIALDGIVVGTDTTPDPTTHIDMVSSISVAVGGDASSPADIRLILQTPLPITQRPEKGAKVSIKGIPTSFSPNPPVAGKPVVITLKEGSLVGK